MNVSTTPLVQYDYETSSPSPSGAGGYSRLTKINCPDGYELDYNYATGVDDNFCRLTSISDSTRTLEGYAYRGEGAVLERNHAQPGLSLATMLGGIKGVESRFDVVEAVKKRHSTFDHLVFSLRGSGE